VRDGLRHRNSNAVDLAEHKGRVTLVLFVSAYSGPTV
jgi:hypothetical protein